MMIDKLGGINPLDALNKTKKTGGVPKPPLVPDDVISVSAEALRKAEAYHLAEIAAATPDVRADLVEKIKEKIKDPSYINAAVIDSAASRIMEAYGL
jgi:negative regulator of flagellin synthesis FlgM